MALPLEPREENPFEEVRGRFFGDFGAMRREEYVDSMAELMQSDAEVYRAIVNDLYNSGRYLFRNKFR
jgi:hypothetical protein